MIKFVFKWAFRLVLAAVLLTVLLVAGVVLALDPILRVVAERNIRESTGMEAEMSRFHLGLTEPVVRIENLKIYNGPEFGGAPFLDVPEVQVEYDRPALKQGRLHLTVLRLNLAELDIVVNEAGKTNLFALGMGAGAKRKAGEKPEDMGEELRRATGLKFEQIDVLNLSVGTLKYIDLGNPRNNRAVKVGLDNVPVRKVRSAADLLPFEVLLGLRSGDFFTQLMLPQPKK